MLRVGVDYEKPGRFMYKTNRQVTVHIINTINHILSSTLFDIEGPGSKYFGILDENKLMDDASLYFFKNLRTIVWDNKTFSELMPNEQMETIIGYFCHHYPKLKDRLCENARHFVQAILSKDSATLDVILKRVTTQPNTTELNCSAMTDNHVTAESQDNRSAIFILLNTITSHDLTARHIGNKTIRELCIFTKEQAMVASKWWFELIVRSTVECNATDNARLKLMFVTFLADKIWESALSQSRFDCRGFKNPIIINYSDKHVQNALTHADINARQTTSLSLDDSSVKITTNNNLISHHEGTMQFISMCWPRLPNDNVILFRDLLSTITTGKSGATAAISLYYLSKHLLYNIMLFSRPNTMSIEQAKCQIAWNQHRFFLKGECGQALIKVEDPAWETTKPSIGH